MVNVGDIILDDPDKREACFNSNDANKKYALLADNDFFTIPIFEKYAVNRSGLVYSKVRERILMPPHRTISLHDGSRIERYHIRILIIRAFYNNITTEQTIYDIQYLDTTRPEVLTCIDM